MKIFSSGYNSVQSDLVCKGQTRLMTMCVQDRFLESKGLLLRTEHPECISLFPALLWSLEIGHNGSLYTINPANASNWDIFFSWKSIYQHTTESGFTSALVRTTFRKLRSWHLVPSLPGKYMGKQWKQWQTLFSWALKITADGDCSQGGREPWG